jgi:hypothetical protein
VFYGRRALENDLVAQIAQGLCKLLKMNVLAVLGTNAVMIEDSHGKAGRARVFLADATLAVRQLETM